MKKFMKRIGALAMTAVMAFSSGISIENGRIVQPVTRCSVGVKLRSNKLYLPSKIVQKLGNHL